VPLEIYFFLPFFIGFFFLAILDKQRSIFRVFSSETEMRRI